MADSPGSFQSSWTVPAFTVHKLPPHLDLQIGALTEPLAVACHDVKMGEVKPGELAVVIGGGPIGMLVAMVARHAGARVIISEINEYRLHFARSIGFEAFSPIETDLAEWLRGQSNGSGADVVFEVSGSKAAAMAMTDLSAIRGRVVLVGVHTKPTEINLFQLFWKELKLIGARVYEPDDYQKAIELMASNALPLARMITEVQPLENVQQAFEKLEASPSAMKVLLDCRG